MSEYTYTVDVIGDDALADSVIMKTVTEVIDQHIKDDVRFTFKNGQEIKA